MNGTLYVESIGVRAPGLDGWQNASSVLSGEVAYEPASLPRYKPARLPANERRRATELVRLAFAACEDAVASSTIPVAELTSVFASSGGDYPIIDQICRALMQEQRMVSPTQFHNSVHNSAAGYWSIATGAVGPSTSLSARDDSVAVGLLEAAMTLQQQPSPLLLACYDIVPPQPLRQKRPISQPFAAALVLTSEEGEHSLARLKIAKAAAGPGSECFSPALEPLRRSNPAAKILPLLEHLAAKSKGRLTLPLSPAVNIEVHIE